MRSVPRSPKAWQALAVGSVFMLAAILAIFPAGDSTPLAAAGQDEGAAGADVDAGERVFQSQCAMCHGADAEGMMGMHPSLRGAIERLSREGVEVAIRQGRRTDPPMPAFEDRLSPEEVDAVIAYIASLPDGPRNFGPGSEGGMMGDGGMMGGDGVDADLVLLGALVAVAVMAGIGLAIVRTRTAPRRLLDRRYATGELSRDDYMQRRHDLEHE